MRLGIDFGTTHTVVAVVDRGNYPVVSFEGADYCPSLVSVRKGDGELRFGAEAAAVRHEAGWSLLRSFKRLLADAGPDTQIELAGGRHRLSDLLAGFLTHVHRELVERSNAGLAADEALDAAVSVPANASSAQRFLMLDACRRAGFHVVALLNEPSAAGFEYAHRFRSTITSKREYVLVYDLGGGTFDASLLKMTGRRNEVVSSQGIRRLGGDDFDEAILELVLSKSGSPSLDAGTRALLLEECARQKEAVGPNTRRLLVDLSPLEAGPVAVPIDEVYSACAPLVERTLEATEPLVTEGERDAQGTVDFSEVAGIYVVGGAGAFPLVARRLKERFGEKRVKRSPHPFAATAIGLALFLDEERGWELSERFTRTFGVFREAEAGGAVAFDPIFSKDTPLPAAGEPPLTVARRYRAAHNVGHFRFVECSKVEGGVPDGDVAPWDEIRFPFDPALHLVEDLLNEPVLRLPGEGPEVEERYAFAADGTVDVTVTLLDGGFFRMYRIARAGSPS